MTAKHILIVDDTREISRLLEAALNILDSKLETKVVPSAEEAFLEVTRRGYDLIVVDVRLPGISGLEFTQKIHSVSKDIRIIQISGLSDPNVRDNAISMGADVFLPKPLAIGEFLSTVEGLLSINKVSKPLSPQDIFENPPANRPGVFSKPPQSAPLASSGVRPPEVKATPSKSEPLVSQKKSGPPTPINTSPLTNQLSVIRQKLDAVVVALVDDRGQMVAQKGILPEPEIKTSIIEALLGSLNTSVSAGKLVNPQGPESAFLARGPVYTYLAAPLNERYLIFMVVKRSEQWAYLERAIEEIFHSRELLFEALNKATFAEPVREFEPAIGQAAAGSIGQLQSNALSAPESAASQIQPEKTGQSSGYSIDEDLDALLNQVSQDSTDIEPPAAPVEPPPPPPAAENDLDTLLNQASPGSIKSDELDAFWEELATGKKSKSSSKPGSLSFDQASRLGLTPPEEEDA